MPEHFDPAVLKGFKETADLFEEAYERLKGLIYPGRNRHMQEVEG